MSHRTGQRASSPHASHAVPSQADLLRAPWATPTALGVLSPPHRPLPLGAQTCNLPMSPPLKEGVALSNRAWAWEAHCGCPLLSCPFCLWHTRSHRLSSSPLPSVPPLPPRPILPPGDSSHPPTQPPPPPPAFGPHLGHLSTHVPSGTHNREPCTQACPTCNHPGPGHPSPFLEPLTPSSPGGLYCQ